jgi:hypothetical protein
MIILRNCRLYHPKSSVEWHFCRIVEFRRINRLAAACCNNLLLKGGWHETHHVTLDIRDDDVLPVCL